MSKTDRSRSIPNRSQVRRNVAGNSPVSLGRTVKQTVNTDIIDPSPLDVNKALAGRFAQNEARNIMERGLPPARSGKRGNPAEIVPLPDPLVATLTVATGGGILHGYENTGTIPGSDLVPKVWEGQTMVSAYAINTNSFINISFDGGSDQFGDVTEIVWKLGGLDIVCVWDGGSYSGLSAAAVSYLQAEDGNDIAVTFVPTK